MNKQNKQTKLYTLNTAVLERGDIILTTSKHHVSNIIRIITFGPYSHAMIYLGGNCCADASGPGARVASYNTQRIFFDTPKHCCVLRFKETLTNSQLNSIVDYAKRMIGMEYSMDEAKLAALRLKIDAKEINRQFCSRYVAQAYESIGIDIVKNPDYCSPAEIFRSELLKKVENHLRIASNLEIEIFSQESVPLNTKDYADHYKFSNAKALSGFDIQTDEQFNGVLILKPALDAQFSQILIDSGYLDLWQLEKNENPENYDFALLESLVQDGNQLMQTGNDGLEIENQLQRSFIITLQTLQNSYSAHPLNSLKLQIDLYKTLIDLSKIREGVWKQCISIK